MAAYASSVIYEVFPRNHGHRHNFRDIIEDLPRIRSLGTDIIWIMPVNPVGKLNRKGSLGSPYAIRDYRALDPGLGDLTAFKALTEAVHTNSMKLIIDIVFNHTACDSILVEQHPDWFLRGDSGEYIRKQPDWSDVYDLDYSNPELVHYQIETLNFWKKRGVDGFRCDVAPLVPLDFWRAARKAVDPHRKMIWLAESVHKAFVHRLRKAGYICSSDPELHAVFDLTFDYDGYEYLEPALEKGRSVGPLLNHLFIQQTLYPADACKLRFLENHDLPRVAGRVPEPERLKNWSAFYALLPGAALIYAGQEFAMTRLPNLFQWDEIKWPEEETEFYIFFRKLMRTCKAVKLKGNNFDILECQPGLIKIDWSGSKEKFTALMDLADETSELHLETPLSGEELLTGNLLSRQNRITRRMLPLICKSN